MRSRLGQVQDWEHRARRANYHVDRLARECAVTPRQLHRFFLATFGQPPKTWLRTIRMQLALALLRQGKSVKETAQEVGLRFPEELSREVKRATGTCASTLFLIDRDANGARRPGVDTALLPQIPPRMPPSQR